MRACCGILCKICKKCSDAEAVKSLEIIFATTLLKKPILLMFCSLFSLKKSSGLGDYYWTDEYHNLTRC